MKITLPIHLFVSLMVFASGHLYAHVEHITADKDDLLQVIHDISQRYDVHFTYDREIVENVEIVEYAPGSYASAEDALSSVLAGTSLKYVMLEMKYVIIYQDDAEGMKSLEQMVEVLEKIIEQKREKRLVAAIDRLESSSHLNRIHLERRRMVLNVSGIVTDVAGEPLIGVNVVVQGTTIGTATDIDGRFVLEDVNENATLVFSYVGYQTLEFPLNGRSNIAITLQEDLQTLDEVVVVGYGTQKKASLVGAISQIDAEELEKVGSGISNLGQALTGKLPGVATVQQSGQPGGDDPRILIRGQGTWNAANPLILVDGIERRMNDIDASEVASISILKDASATAIYGVKGSEGVILITTKRGKVGPPVIDVNASVSTKDVSRLPDKLNSYDQFKFRNQVLEYELNSGGGTVWETYIPEDLLQNYKHPQAPGMQYIFPDVDWVETMVKPFPVSSRLNLNVTGGTEFAKYFASLSYMYDDDVIRTGHDPTGAGYESKMGYDRINFRTNLDLDITRSTVFSVNIGGYVGNQTGGFKGDSKEIFFAFSGLSPDEFPIFQEDGSYGYNPNDAIGNPMLAANNRGLGEERRTNVLTDFVIRQELDFVTKGLSAEGSLSYDNTFYTFGGIEDGGTRQLYIDPEIVNIKEGERPEDYMEGYIHNQSSNHDYDWVRGANTYVAESGNAGGTLSASYRRLFYQMQINYARTFGKHDVTGLALMNREEFARGSIFPRYREDWVGRVTYGYDGRYLFESNFAYNGSEKFAPGRRFGFFPSLAVGWVLSKEKFMDFNWLDLFKLRYSIGKVGNDNFNAARWSYRTTWSLDQDNTYFGYPQIIQSPYNQYIEEAVGNPLLSWETSLKQNLGVELGFFDSRVNITADIFKDYRTNIFLSGGQRTLVPYLGQNPAAANLGEVEVKGYEVEFSLRNRTGQFDYYVSANHTGAFDKVLYQEDAVLLPEYRKNEGYAIDQVRSQINVGFLDNWDEVYSATPFNNNAGNLPGDNRILDYSGSGVIDGNATAPYAYPQDRPQHTYSISLGGSYQGFSASVQFYGMYNILRQYNEYLTVPFYNRLNSGPVLYHHLDMWTPDDPNGRYRHQRLNYQANPGYGTVMWVDGSNFRLKNAEIAYTFNRGFVERLGLRDLKLYLRGTNLILWSRMVEDREARAGERNSVYPLVKRYNLGVNLSF